MTINDAILKAKKTLDLIKYNFTYYFDFSEAPTNLVVTKTLNHVSIRYHELCQLFYGLTVLKQNVNRDEFSIMLPSNFKYNGSMFDCSRNQVLNLKSIKDIIEKSALMGLNRFMLYTEDVYEVEGEPYFGYLRGRYTKEEIKEIVEYGNCFGVDIIPCIQTLSHLNQALRWSTYCNIQDTMNTLDTNAEGVYDFIRKLISTCRENFTSKYIHIGMDEASDMGFKKFILENRLIDKKETFLSHLNKVVDICHSFDFTPMMWIDMFYKIDSKSCRDWYDFKGYLEQSIKDNIPDVELIYWNYYDDNKDRYDRNIKTALDTRKHITFASGLIRWVGMVANITPSLVKCSSGLQASLDNHLDSVFATTWGDGGSGSSYTTLFTILALHSSFQYGSGSYEEASSLLETITGISLIDWTLLEIPNRLRNELLPFENPSTPFLFQDPLLGLFDTRVKDNYEVIYYKYSIILHSVKAGRKYGYVYSTYASLCNLLNDKVVLGKDLRERYQNKDIIGLEESVKAIKRTIFKLDNFIEKYFYMYRRENKPFGQEINDGRLGFLRQRLVTALNLVNQYLNHQIDKIEELEEKILPYNGANDDEPHCYNTWGDIISTNNIK